MGSKEDPSLTHTKGEQNRQERINQVHLSKYWQTYIRNAYTGNILSITQHPENSDADTRGAIRARRTRLQSALLDKVPEGLIQFNKKLVSLEDLPGAGVRLVFDDQTDTLADLVVGADGIHSVCHAFPPTLITRN